MPKKKLIEDINTEVKSPVKQDDALYNRQIKPVAKPEPKIGIDVDQEFYDTLITAAKESKVDIAKLESFTQISQNRNLVYNLIDTMADDSTIAAVLETYVEDATETGINGRIVWAESQNEDISKYITYLLDTMNVDKNAYKWIYSLTKYGDLYLRLFRESEYNDKLFDTENKEDQEKHNQSKKLTEELSKILDNNYGDVPEVSLNEAAELDDLDEGLQQDNNTNILNEDVKIKMFSKNDRYVHYLEAMPNPAEVYELTKLGKSYAYIFAPNSVTLNRRNDVLQDFTMRYSYAFKKKDVQLFEATEFVHAALEDNSSRTPEEVNIFLNDNDYETGANAMSYKVRRGQSALYNSYKIWREMMLLEYSLLLNRVTKSSIVRVIGVEVGDMPKEQIGPHLQGIKSLMEQKSSLDVGNGMSEYTNPGPVENNIYVPTHDGKGAITPQVLGGDADVKGLADLDYFNNKLFGSLKVPKQYFGFTDDAAGFDGGTSLSLLSSRYAKTVKKIQNTFTQALTDAINLMLIDKGLTSYVNKFELHMVPPTTREEVDRNDATSAKIQIANDVMNLVAEIKDLSSRLQILKAMLADAISDETVSAILQKEIDRLEDLKAQGLELDENGDPIIPEDTSELTGDVGGDFSGDSFDFSDDFSGSDNVDNDTTSDMDLPTPDSLGVDFTDSENM